MQCNAMQYNRMQCIVIQAVKLDVDVTWLQLGFDLVPDACVDVVNHSTCSVGVSVYKVIATSFIMIIIL